MNRLVVIVALVSIMNSCSKNDDEFYSYSFVNNARLNIETIDGSYMKYGNIVEGDNLVFEYEYIADNEEQVADDEYSEFIYFEIDESLNEFYYADDKLTTINATFTKVCFCAFMDNEKNVAATGFIRGKKLSDTQWDITIEVTFYGDQSKNISNIFRLKT